MQQALPFGAAATSGVAGACDMAGWLCCTAIGTTGGSCSVLFSTPVSVRDVRSRRPWVVALVTAAGRASNHVWFMNHDVATGRVAAHEYLAEVGTLGGHRRWSSSPPCPGLQVLRDRWIRKTSYRLPSGWWICCRSDTIGEFGLESFDTRTNNDPPKPATRLLSVCFQGVPGLRPNHARADPYGAASLMEWSCDPYTRGVLVIPIL
jgi:hypothetical protein